MKFNLGFFYLYNMIIISLEIEYFEYYYIFPLLKEILNYYGYTLNFNYLKKLTQQVLINTSQLTKWGRRVYKYFNKIYYNKKFLMIVKKKNLKIYSRLETKIYIEKFITNQAYLLIKNSYYLYNKKKKIKKNIYKNKNLQKKKFLYFVFKLIVSYKKWKADKLYIKMAHVAYCENLISLSIKLLKMARFEKQTSFFFIYISKI